METLVQKFARNKNLEPDTRNAVSYNPPYPINESTDSLYLGSPNPRLLDQKKLENLEKNTPNPSLFQETKLAPAPKKALHEGSFPIWLTQLQDPTIHPYSLVPFPNTNNTDLSEILTLCLEYRVLPDRIAWVLHTLIYKNGMQSDIDKAILKLMTPENSENLWKLSRFCFNLNLFNHYNFLASMIEYINQSAIIIFKDQLIQTHSILRMCLQKPGRDFLMFFQEELLKQKTHLIQLSVLSNYLQQFEQFQPRIMKLIQPNLNLMKRAKVLYNNLTHTRLPYAILLRNLIINSFPFYDIKKFSAEIEKILLFMDPNDGDNVAINLLEILFWFEENNITLPAALAFVLSKLPITRDFLDLFIEFVYDNCDRIKPLRYLFSELQERNILTYNLFINRIKQFGYFISEKEKTKIVIENFPFIGRSKQSATTFSDAMRRVDSTQYDEILWSFIEEKETKQNEKIQTKSNP